MRLVNQQVEAALNELEAKLVEAERQACKLQAQLSAAEGSRDDAHAKLEAAEREMDGLRGLVDTERAISAGLQREKARASKKSTDNWFDTAEAWCKRYETAAEQLLRADALAEDIEAKVKEWRMATDQFRNTEPFAAAAYWACVGDILPLLAAYRAALSPRGAAPAAEPPDMARALGEDRCIVCQAFTVALVGYCAMHIAKLSPRGDEAPTAPSARLEAKYTGHWCATKECHISGSVEMCPRCSPAPHGDTVATPSAGAVAATQTNIKRCPKADTDPDGGVCDICGADKGDPCKPLPPTRTSASNRTDEGAWNDLLALLAVLDEMTDRKVELPPDIALRLCNSHNKLRGILALGGLV
jgi:hypothetical protein